MHGRYPERGYANELLREEFQVMSLEKRRIVSSLKFFVQLINGKVDCALLLDQIRFRDRRPGCRYDVAFWCPQARTNVMIKSPLYVMTSCFNKVCSEFNMFESSPGQLSELVNRNF